MNPKTEKRVNRLFEYMEEQHEAAKKQFLDRMKQGGKDIAGAIGWQGDEIVTAQMANTILQEVKDQIERSTEPAAVVQRAIDTLYKQLADETFEPNSTGVFHNAVTIAEGRGAKKALTCLKSIIKDYQEESD